MTIFTENGAENINQQATKAFLNILRAMDIYITNIHTEIIRHGNAFDFNTYKFVSYVLNRPLQVL